MITIYWFIIMGALFVSMALAGTTFRRLPLTVTMLYLGLGYALGPMGIALHRFYPLESTVILERVSEILVIVSLFTAGLKLRLPVRHRAWRVPYRLAFLSMTVSVGLVAVAGYWGLGLPIGAAILLGAILSPTDPVLASDVQVENEHDQDPLRFGLTGEAGLNDGTAFPFVMLGLGLLGLHDLGIYGWRWVVVDVVWAISGGLAIGWFLGSLIGRVVLYLRREHKEAVGTDEFLALGLIGLSYGAALWAYTYGFLAVFAAGLALRNVERRANEEVAAQNDPVASTPSNSNDLATHPEHAPRHMAEAVLGFNEQLERITTMVVVLLVGGMIYPILLRIETIWLIPVLFFAIRPLSVAIGLAGASISKYRFIYMSWFGIRGIGSIYYLMYAIEHGLPPEYAAQFVNLTFMIVAISIIIHGISVNPLMRLYRRRAEKETVQGS